MFCYSADKFESRNDIVSHGKVRENVNFKRMATLHSLRSKALLRKITDIKLKEQIIHISATIASAYQFKNSYCITLIYK